MSHYTLCILLIENSMGMHSVVPGCKVLQVDHNNVINLGSQYGPQEAQPGRSGGQVPVRRICILPEHGLLINTANAVGSSFQEYRCMPEIEVDGRQKEWEIQIQGGGECAGGRRDLKKCKDKVRLLSYYTVQDCTMTCSFTSLSCYVHIFCKKEAQISARSVKAQMIMNEKSQQYNKDTCELVSNYK